MGYIGDDDAVLLLPMLTRQVDILVSFAWFATFGVLVDALERTNCNGYWYGTISVRHALCEGWKAAEAFSFLSGITWFFSGLMVSTVCHHFGAIDSLPAFILAHSAVCFLFEFQPCV